MYINKLIIQVCVYAIRGKVQRKTSAVSFICKRTIIILIPILVFFNILYGPF